MWFGISVANFLLVFAIAKLVSKANWTQAAKANQRKDLVQSLLNVKASDKYERQADDKVQPEAGHDENDFKKV